MSLFYTIEVRLNVFTFCGMASKELRAISYQFTPTFFTSHERSKTSETRMHYAMCWA